MVMVVVVGRERGRKIVGGMMEGEAAKRKAGGECRRFNTIQRARGRSECFI